MINFKTYSEMLDHFSWSQIEKELSLDSEEWINIGYHCSDRICNLGLGGKLALIWENYSGIEKRYTFDDLRKYSDAIAAHLRALGIKKGERVCLFLDRTPELYISFLGILKLGAIVQPLFSAFGHESLVTRLQSAESAAIITQKRLLSRIRKVLPHVPHIRHVLVTDLEDSNRLREKESTMIMDALPQSDDFITCRTSPETPSVLHYTSGTTGKPKGALHVHSSIISQHATTRYVLDLCEDDIYWCTADPGWVTGTSYGIIGPWSIGATQVVLDSGFFPEKWYDLIQRHRITVWYTAPTAIRSLMKRGTELVQRYDLSSLRHICSVGEPLNPEAVIWSTEAFGRTFHDTYWQTETGCIVVANYPMLDIRPGSMGRPFPGINVKIVDMESFEVIVNPNQIGLIAIQPNWPSMFRKYWNADATYQNKFTKGWYITGDRAYFDSDGYFWFVGRDDDVINTGGHLVGPFEIESALIEHEAVAESAAVGKPDPINMEVVKAFVALNPGFEPSQDLQLNIMNFIRKRLSPLAMPQEIEFVDSLPKTRSGKIMRRVLRAREWGESIGDTSTMDDD